MSTSGVNGTIANVEQAEAWDGDEGEHWATHQERYDAMSAGFVDDLFQAAAVTTHDLVLDIGCGCGATTREAARRASHGRAVGIDLSGPMLDRARRLAATEGLANVSFDHGDAQTHPFPPGRYDVAISRFGVMFFAGPIAAFTNIADALHADGRIAFLCWQDITNNPWLMVPAAAALEYVPFPDLGAPGDPGPFSLADPDHLEGILTNAGFSHITAESVVAPLVLGRDADDAVDFIRGTALARTLLGDADPELIARVLDALRDVLRPYETSTGVHLDGAAWLVTATRT